MRNDASNAIPMFLDDDTSLLVPRTATRFHPSEADLKAWFSRDGTRSPDEILSG